MKQTLNYKVVNGRSIKLDIYPVATNRPAPTIVYVHGGGWVGGDKGLGVSLGFNGTVRRLKQMGYVYVTVNYRLAPWSCWPAQLEDVKCAIRYLRAHATEYGIDAERIGGWGDSAGGQLAAMLGLTIPADGFDVGEHLEQSSAVQAVVDMFGPSDLTYYLNRNGLLRRYLYMLMGSRTDEAAVRLASPISYVHAGAPPFLLIHGERDMMVPAVQSRTLHGRLIAAEVDARLVMVENGNHALLPMGVRQPGFAELNEMVIRFFEQHLGRGVHDER